MLPVRRVVFCSVGVLATLALSTGIASATSILDYQVTTAGCFNCTSAGPFTDIASYDGYIFDGVTMSNGATDASGNATVALGAFDRNNSNYGDSPLNNDFVLQITFLIPVSVVAGRPACDANGNQECDLQHEVIVQGRVAVIAVVPIEGPESDRGVARGIGGAVRHGDAVEYIPVVGRDVREGSGACAVEAAGRRHLVVQDRSGGSGTPVLSASVARTPTLQNTTRRTGNINILPKQTKYATRDMRDRAQPAYPARSCLPSVTP